MVEKMKREGRGEKLIERESMKKGKEENDGARHASFYLPGVVTVTILTNLDTIVDTKKLLVSKVVSIINKTYKLVSKFVYN